MRLITQYKYIQLGVLPYTAVVNLQDFVTHYDEVCAEFALCSAGYLYTQRDGVHKLIHFTSPENLESILEEGLRVGDAECAIGAAVYAYDSCTPIKKNAYSPLGVAVAFVSDNVYQCVHCKHSYAPIRECVVPHNISPEAIVGYSANFEELMTPLSAPDYLRKVGYPEAEISLFDFGPEQDSIIDFVMHINGDTRHEKL